MRSSSAFHVLSLLQPKIVSCVCLGPEPILYLCMEHQMVSIPIWFITWGKCQGKLSVTNTVSTATVTTLRHLHPLMICSRLRKALGMIWKSCLSHVWQPETQCGRERMLMQRICEWYPAHKNRVESSLPRTMKVRTRISFGSSFPWFKYGRAAHTHYADMTKLSGLIGRCLKLICIFLDSFILSVKDWELLKCDCVGLRPVWLTLAIR